MSPELRGEAVRARDAGVPVRYRGQGQAGVSIHVPPTGPSDPANVPVVLPPVGDQGLSLASSREGRRA